MTGFWQGTAAVLLAVVVGIALSRQGKDSQLLLTLAVCCMVVAAAVSYLSPVISFIHQLQSISQIDQELLQILLKAVGIALIGEITALICSDGGNSALGKAVHILSSAVILWLSLPLLQKLLELLQDILGDV